MSKICRSCGSYYKGDYCDKCGYGKPDVQSKSLEKLKKQAKKPERFMTDQEKKELYDRKRKEREAALGKREDPHARRNLLIVTAVVVVGIVFAVLIKNGLLFSTDKTDVINRYFDSLNERNYDDFVSCFPKEIKNLHESDRKSLGYEKDKFMEVYLSDFTERYGSDMKITVSCGKEEKLEKSEIDLTDYEAQYGSKPSISEAYVVICEVTYSGSKATEVFQYDCYVGKVSGKWKLFNVQYRAGTITTDMEVTDPEQYADTDDISSAAE
ncbi:MAG: hypothetical protein ACI4JA_00225 [Oscillospiraceae bacterium]